MQRRRLFGLAIVLAASLASLSAIGAQAGAGKNAFRQNNLVSSVPRMAQFTDPSLRNP